MAHSKNVLSELFLKAEFCSKTTPVKSGYEKPVGTIKIVKMGDALPH